MKNSIIITFFLLVLALMSFTSEFEKQEKFSKNTSLFDTIKVSDTIVVDTIDFNIEMYQEDANASYYADKFTGKRTASGAIFNNNELTCAHKKLPFGTKLKVTSVKTGKSIKVTVTDRGPFSKGKDIDLTKKAFMKIAPKRYGSHIEVDIEIIKE